MSSCCFTGESKKSRRQPREKSRGHVEAASNANRKSILKKSPPRPAAHLDQVGVDGTRQTARTTTTSNNTTTTTENPSEPLLADHDDPDALILRLNDAQEYAWFGGHRLSAVLELLEEESRKSTHLSEIYQLNFNNSLASIPRLHPLNREHSHLSLHLDEPRLPESPPKKQVRMSAKASSPGPRPIETPPKDLESISRIDASLVFEHFTTDDAWLLGSALRARLLPIATPVVINISLANQNQTLFHACTHPGVMPDNDSWVARKRKTVLRWGCSTWYMHCKFGGDERAFADKYGLGGEAGTYAIHGGGVPIRVTGVEGVVAVVVVSGLKQHEDHGVVVEVIRELYY